MPRAPQDPQAFRFMPIGKPSEIAWGKLVSEWILETCPRPTSLTTLIAQCDDRGIFYDHPDGLSDEIFILQKPRNVMTIRLPAKELFQLGQQRIKDGLNTYKFPDFYDDFFVGAVSTHLAPISKDKAIELHSARTGEYAINGCA
jgi:hypothetical protein